MYLCVLDAQGSIVLHERIPSQRDAFLKAITPYRDDLVVCAECIFCWYGLADLCSELDVTFVLAHALYLKAIHGGKAKKDRVDSEKLATLLRGGSIPMAHVDPPRMRSTPDLLRRRLFFRRKRAELLSHIQNTFHQYNVPKPPRQALEHPDRRGELVRAFDDVAVQASLEADLTLCGHYEDVLDDLERILVRQGRIHEPSTLRLRSRQARPCHLLHAQEKPSLRPGPLLHELNPGRREGEPGV